HHQKCLPYPDTAPVLRALRQRGLRVGIVSNVAEDLRPVFVARGWGDLVDGYTHSYEHRIEKPDVRIFLAACRAMGTAPSETLVVGDHAVDAGAVVAGCVVLLLPRVEPGRARGLERVLGLVGESTSSG